MMTNRILDALSVAAGPQTAVEVRDTLRRWGERVEEFEVIEELRGLQKGGVVSLDGVRWRLLRLPQRERASIVPDTPRIQSPLPVVGNSAAAASAPARPAVVRVEAPPGRWAIFRRLCRYYIDCLLSDESPQIRGYIENEDDTWISVAQVPWMRLAESKEFAVSLGKEQAGFQRNRARRGENECVYLGYPSMLAKPKSGSDFVVPLLVQPMKADWRSGILRLEADGPIAVNSAWLEFQYPRKDEREAFLRAMGLLRDVDSEDEANETAPSASMNFAQMAQDVANYIHDTDRFAENIQPFDLTQKAFSRGAKPGLYNAAILTLGPRLRYTRSLTRDLRDIAEKLTDEDLDRTALSSLFPHEAAASAPPTPGEVDTDPGMQVSIFEPEDLAQLRLLHSNQRAAVVNAMSAKVSVVTGPPGTGKSEVVAAMLLNELLRGREALFASKNHQALDAVLPRLNDATEESALVVQASSRDRAQRQDYLEKLQSLLARPARADAFEGDELRSQLARAFGEQRELERQLIAIDLARREYGALNSRVVELKESLPRNLQSGDTLSRWPEGVTLQQVESVEAEVLVAYRRPVGLLGKLLARIRKRKIGIRRSNARDSLSRFPTPFADRNVPFDADSSDAFSEFFLCWKRWAELAATSGRVRACEDRIAGMTQPSACNQGLAETQKSIEDLTRRWKEWASGGLAGGLSPSDREALANLRAGIKNWGTTRFADQLRRYFPLILRAAPLWSVSNLSARSALPLLPGLFDLVIIDEASQSDIASIVPLLARSRRAVLVGDPMQLTHISKLDEVVERSLLAQHGLTDAEVQRFSYRVNSAFDLAQANAAVPESCRTRLDLHFRSHGLIADYCNEAFYGKTLNVVTATERLKIPRGMRPGIHWTQVSGAIVPGPSGSYCADEIEVIGRELAKLANDGYEGTIGVVTPFAIQMSRLSDALENSEVLPLSFRERVRFLVATAHGFQGDERDLIMFSLCGGPGMAYGSIAFLQKSPNLFNVAVSRARAVLHVVGNREWALACGVPFIEKLARHTLPDHVARPTNHGDPYQSPWEKVLHEALARAGIEALPQYPIAGRFLDLGILSPVKLDIEVDGEHHRTARGGRKDDDHWRDLQLQSLGWKVCRFWVYELREDLKRCVNKVASLLHE
jgi:very-short-patch-repair endonuclease